MKRFAIVSGLLVTMLAALFAFPITRAAADQWYAGFLRDAAGNLDVRVAAAGGTCARYGNFYRDAAGNLCVNQVAGGGIACTATSALPCHYQATCAYTIVAGRGQCDAAVPVPANSLCGLAMEGANGCGFSGCVGDGFFPTVTPAGSGTTLTVHFLVDSGWAGGATSGTLAADGVCD